MTTFVGRRREIDEARACLQRSRLVSLLGPGGVGKTRLAEEIAVRSSRAFRDSVRWIDLAVLRDAEAVPTAAAAALGVTDQSTRPVMGKIVDHLQGRHMLIVVDNCEHLIDTAAGFVSTILAHAPEIRILVTSREPLTVAGEVEFVIPPLTIPLVPTGNRAAGLARYESVSLLVERAQRVVPDFELTDDNADAVAQLCIQLDGIPLALELAATRLRSLSPGQLVERLDRRFTLLTGGGRTAVPRQQTLRALIDWSYDLCSEAERVLWARLSVFTGGFDLEAAEVVCADENLPEERIVDLLDRLIAKSLVGVDRSSSILRYSQLMTVREYGHELLVAREEQDELYRRHRAHCLDRARRCAESWFGSQQSSLLARLRTDHADFMTALDRSLRDDSEPTTGAALAVALRYHWIAGGNLSTGRIRLERLLQRLPASSPERGDVLWVTAWTALIQGDRDGAALHLSECAAVAEESGDDRLRAHHDHWAALHALFCGDTARAIALYEAAVSVHRAYGDDAAYLTALFQLAMAQAYDGRLDEALVTCGRVVEVADEHGERWNKAYALWVSGVAYFHLGRLADSVRVARQALRIQRDFKDKICTALSIELLAWSAGAEGDHEEAAVLLGAARTVWQRLGTTVAAFGPHIERDSLAVERRLRSVLGEDGFARLAGPLDDGTTIEQVVDRALAPHATPPPRGTSQSRAGGTTGRPESPLTKRESEVARLVADGLSNRAIAERLVISRRTVDGHVERILDKLGVGSRTQVVAWMHTREIPGV
ncbi:LuxR C-terminal-related transcriptional regulator [Rhodococcus sp. Z13]|uniref:LuxR C-terminal-related transcriptional regulator n=1 Tax=Rhodococcus sacchari TaxID=2962047 RepID=A0ACD4DK16_9NOCA|nr:LuxR C-terminal-related transcriptional regulator [Rhodococcus sp. Z13]UYP20409.1 LuxR C-terminal-related transcriptional regulator [Rhodococcus sp. Z13]